MPTDDFETKALTEELIRVGVPTAAEHVVHEAVQLHGGMGFMRESEVERHYRDIRVMGIGGGTSEIMNEVIARRVVGR